MSNPRLERIAEAYLAMAGQARYRPQALGDGFGNILLTRKECGDVERLHREAVNYALKFSAEEDERTFWIGCSNFTTKPSLRLDDRGGAAACWRRGRSGSPALEDGRERDRPDDGCPQRRHRPDRHSECAKAGLSEMHVPENGCRLADRASSPSREAM
jgi:hypothetical protein